MSISNNNFRESSKPTKKVCDENKTNKEKTTGAYPRVIIILVEGSSLYGCYAKR